MQVLRTFADDAVDQAASGVTPQVVTGAQWTVQANALSLDNRIVANDQPSGSVWKVASIDAAGEAETLDVVCLMRFQDGLGTPRMGIILRGSADGENWNGYVVHIDRTTFEGRLRIQSVVNGSFSTVAQAASFSFSGANDPFFLRAQSEGSTIRAKWWPLNAAEPEWQLSGSNSDHNSGFAGFANTQAASPMRYDAIGIGTDGDLPPFHIPEPQGILAINEDHARIAVSWGPVPAIGRHDLRWSVNGNEWTVVENVAVPFIHDDLEQGAMYAYQARAWTPAYQSEWSESAIAETTNWVALEASSGIVSGARAQARSGIEPEDRSDISAFVSTGGLESSHLQPVDDRLFYFDQGDDPLGAGSGVQPGGWSWPRSTYLYVGTEWAGAGSAIRNRSIYHAGDLPEGVSLYFRVMNEYEQATGPASGSIDDGWRLMTDTPQLYDDEPAVIVPGQRNGAICQIAAFVEGGDWPDVMVALPRIVWLYHIS